MGKRIAILAGVSSYQYENDLPPCEEDLLLMTEVISNAGKFDEWIIINNSPKSGEAKDKISSFVRKYQKQDVSEVFFYYTGHGSRNSDDFLFLFSDYNNSKSEQTSLRNSELDLMLKSLQSELTVKVVDACQAGTEYIKSDQDLRMIFEKSSTDSFNKAYFFFSSSSAESSVAHSDFSVFTKSFAKSLINCPAKDVRYRDIMAYISDDSGVSKHQTPLFIQQAYNTEVFCAVSADLISAVSQKLGMTHTQSEEERDEGGELAESQKPYEENILSTIKLKSRDYCKEEEALESLAFFIESIENYDWGRLIDGLYDVKVEKVSSYEKVVGIKNVSEWLSKSDEQYFAEVIYTEEEYEAREKVEIEDVPGGAYGALMSLAGTKRRIEYKPVTRYRNVVDRIQLTAPSPCCALIIHLSPKEEILLWRKAFIVFVFSKSKLTIFFKMEKEKEVSWNQRITQDKNQWKTIHCKLKEREDIKQAVESALASMKDSLVFEITLEFDEQ